VMERMPGEAMVYLGDTARVPYGVKSADTVVRYARACARILLEHDVKLLVVACNTASACALEALRAETAVPVIGVIEPGARFAVEATRDKRVGVIGTAGTIRSGAYPKVIRVLAPSVEVFSKACPLFVPLAEEGWTEGPVTAEVVKTYLEELREQRIDTLVLGCTHYPLLTDCIAAYMGPEVTLIDSAEATAAVVAETLERMDMSASRAAGPRHRFLVSDSPEGFERVSRRFLGRPVDHVEWVDF